MKRYWLIIITSLLLVVTGIIVKQWHVWFGNQPEASYVVPDRPDRITLTFGEQALSQRTVTWRCDTVLRPSYLLLASDNQDTIRIPAEGTLVASRAGIQAFYEVHLDSLLENKAYSFQIQSGLAYSDWSHFRTASASDSLHFLLFGDLQDEHLEPSKSLFNQAVEKYPLIDFVAFVGDIIERPMDKYWQIVYETIDTVSGNRPIVACTGNHEYLKGVVKKLDSRWIHTFSNPHNGPECAMGRSYYIDFQNLRYVILDTDGLQFFTDYLATRRWLSHVLESNEKRWTIVVMHHPLYSASIGRNNVLMRWCFQSVLEKHQVDIVFAGHDHSFARRNTRDSDGTSTTPVYFLTTFSEKKYLSNCDLSAQKIGCGHRLYQYVTSSNNQLHVQSYLAESHILYDDVEITYLNGHKKLIDAEGNRIPELIDLPQTYEASSSSKVNKFYKKRAARQSKLSLMP